MKNGRPWYFKKLEEWITSTLKLTDEKKSSVIGIKLFESIKKGNLA